MRNLVRKLGKPRSWWLCWLAAVVALVAGALLVGLYFAGIESAAQVGIWVITACWLAGVAALVVYYMGQLRGRYHNLHGKSWSQLPW
jgi:hypothetical protein